jgi:hypothetical protein
MQPGGRRQIVIPPDLGYGAEGSGEDIGPDETLIFVVDVVEVCFPDAEAPPAEGEGEGGETTTPAEGESGETTTTAAEGEGAETTAPAEGEEPPATEAEDGETTTTAAEG